MNGESFPDFTGKVVTVQLGTPPVSLALEQVRYERHVGKLYLIGRQVAVPERPTWVDGAICYIAPEQLTYFAVFDSLDVYLTRVAAWYRPTPPQLGPGQQAKRRGWFGRE
jgi:hypothetical protein